MPDLLLAAVADDDTGASDLAGMLAERGLRVILVIDLPEPEKLAEWACGHEAIVVATATRAIAPRDAYEKTRAAVNRLRALKPRQIQLKYCSTFDSTEKGNIGPSIDAAMDELDEKFTVALPALPVNGRTTFFGHHFVHGELLSDSPMSRHPLNPMTNPNLVKHLQWQTRRKVGLADFRYVNAGADALRSRLRQLAQEFDIVIVDCIDNDQVSIICDAIAGMALITGSSAPGIGLPGVWRRLGWWKPEAGVQQERVAEDSAGCLFIAGSCSVATRAQNRWLLAQGAEHFEIDPKTLLESKPAQLEAIAVRAGQAIAAGRRVLITTASEPDVVKRTQEWAAAQGKSAEQIGLEIAGALARFCQMIVERQKPAGLVLAGGETSSAICRQLCFGALRVGANIEPGVPICRTLDPARLPVVLKSGNFGSEDFFGRAERALRTPA
ncbi:MAG: four-carbon acid sugar kinase family protein [Acidimicrobiia bacterium]|nr:four-carbon acid sugar kinase family protein [Acidimicrobiia bacterium]